MIINNLDSFLRESEETLYSLAKKTGISYRQLLKINNNRKANIQTDTIDKILNVLNCDMQDILTFISDSEFEKSTIEQVSFNYLNMKLLYNIFYDNEITIKELDIPIEKSKYYYNNKKIYFKNDSDSSDFDLNFNVRVMFFCGEYFLYFNEFDVDASLKFSDLSYEELIKQDELDWLINSREGIKTMEKVISVFEDYCKKLQIKGIIIDKINNHVIDPYNQNDKLAEYMLQFGYEIAYKAKLEFGQNYLHHVMRESFFLKEI